MREQLEALRIEHRDDPPRRRRWPWVLGFVLLLAVAAAVAVTLWQGGDPRVRVATVREETPSARATVLNATGYVTARRQTNVASKVTGRLVEVAVEEGMPVEQGQVLARLEDSRERAELALAESNVAAARKAVAETAENLRLAELTYERADRLLASKVVGQAEYDDAHATRDALRARIELEREQVSVAESQVALARVALEETVLRAPFDGIVVSKDAEVGEIISTMAVGDSSIRTGVGTVVDMNSLEIEVDVNEAYIGRVRPGQRVEAVIDAYPDWRIPAHVITIIPTADRQKATVQVRIAFDEIDDRVLPDMGVKVSFQDEDAAAADQSVPERPRILVPAAALRSDGGRDVVLVVDRGVARRRAVTTGGSIGEDVEIVSGIAAGERVIVEGPADLGDGDAVRVE